MREPGKTKLLASRIGYLLDDMFVNPESIMCITFTNKAANQLIDRVSGVTDYAKKMWIGTFHGICVKILKRFGSEIGIDDFLILNSKESKKRIKEILQSMNKPDDREFINVYSSKISECKGNMLDPNVIKERATNEDEMDFAYIYQRYQKINWKNKTFDFDDLIVYTTVLLKNPSIKKWAKEKFRYICCDEVQDTSYQQIYLLNLLFSKNLFCVGDLDQSIYGWRGARPEFILNFTSLIPNSEVCKLEQNYRSDGNIIEGANAVIKNNDNRYDKVMFTEREPGAPIIVHEAENNFEEAEYIAKEIKEFVSIGECDYKDVKILYRNNHLSRAIESALIKFSIPYKLFGSTKFEDREEIQDMLSYFRLAANPFDKSAFKRVTCKLAEGIGKTRYEKMIKEAELLNVNYIEIFYVYEDKKKNTRAENSTLKLQKLFKDVSVSPTEFIENIFEYTGYMELLQQDTTEMGKDRVQNLLEFVTLINEYESKQTSYTISDFINDFTLLNMSDETEERDCVGLYTIHSAKGLESKVVFGIGCEEGIIPSFNATTSKEKEEERRCFYVLMTRAEKYLYLTYARERMSPDGKLYKTRPSKFLKEIPEHVKIIV